MGEQATEDATPATQDAKLRVTLAALSACSSRRAALASALAESANAFHRGFRHGLGDWRGCEEDECRKAWAVLLANGGK